MPTGIRLSARVLLHGTDDGLSLFEQSARAGARQRPTGSRAPGADSARALHDPPSICNSRRTTLTGWRDELNDIGARLVALATALDELEDEGAWPEGECRIGAEHALVQLDRVNTAISDAQADLVQLRPRGLRVETTSTRRRCPFQGVPPSAALPRVVYRGAIRVPAARRFPPKGR